MLTRFTASIVVAAGLLLQPSAHAQDVQNTVDRFTGERSIKYEPAPDLNNVTVSTHIVTKGSSNIFSFMNIYAFTRDARRELPWQYKTCHNTDWLADGKPVHLPDVQYVGQELVGGLLEIVSQAASVQQMEVLANASVVEFRICRDEHVLSPADHEGLRKALSAFRTTTN